MSADQPTPADLSPEARRRLADVLQALRGQRVGVLGLGISGRAMALFLARRGAHVLAVDSASALPPAAVAELHNAGIEVRLGAPAAAVFAEVAALCISPGVNPRQAAVQALLQANKPVLGELELCGTLPRPTLAITGTNGKSTTTALAGALVESCGKRAFVGGNFGPSVAAWIDRGAAEDVAVLEVSSYQLDTAYSFAPNVGVVLNVTPDHLERYGSVEAYARAKERLARAVRPDGTVVLNADDSRVAAMAAAARGRVLWFSTTRTELPGDGAVLYGTTLTGVHGLTAFGSVDLRHPRLFGRHNYENALAAFLAVHGLGLAPHAADLLPGYRAFAGLEHRLEWVAEVDGVVYINDSKATNDASAAIGLQAMQPRQVVLLAGGKDKGGGYEQLLHVARKTGLRGLVAFGAAGPVIAAAARAAGLALHQATSLLDACAVARRLAQPGDAVLLSPACSSFDEFTDYIHRGRVFKAWVQSLAHPPEEA